jgi:chorismate mutase
MSEELKDLRKRIDHIDDQLLITLASRQAIANQISQVKGQTKQDKKREVTIIRRLLKINASSNLSDEAIEAIWTVILEQSRKAQAK